MEQITTINEILSLKNGDCVLYRDSMPQYNSTEKAALLVSNNSGEITIHGGESEIIQDRISSEDMVDEVTFSANSFELFESYGLTGTYPNGFFPDPSPEETFFLLTDYEANMYAILHI